MSPTYHRSIGLGGGLLAFIGGAAAWALFGPKIKRKLDENPDWQALRSEVELKAKNISELTRDKYNDLVDEVTSSYSKIRGISDNELRDLAADLKYHWHKIRDRLRD